MNNKILKIGIIGCGRIAKAHATAANAILGLKLAGVYDCCDTYANDFGKLFSCKPYKDINKLIKEVDAIIVCSPNNFHFEHVMLAIENKKHVLCEKPMAISDEESIIMTQAAKDAVVNACVGFNYRYLPVVEIIKEAKLKEEFGKILFVQLFFQKNSAIKKNTFTWRDDSASNQTSGALGDLGSHLIDLALYLFEDNFDVNSIVGTKRTFVQEKENKKIYVDDYFEAYARFEKGSYTKFMASKVSDEFEVGFSIKIIGAKKEFFYHSSFQNSYEITEDLKRYKLAITRPNVLSDPAGEIYGWQDAIYCQLNDFKNKCLNFYPEKTKIANFKQGSEVQKWISIFRDNV